MGSDRDGFGDTGVIEAENRDVHGRVRRNGRRRAQMLMPIAAVVAKQQCISVTSPSIRQCRADTAIRSPISVTVQC